MDFFHDKVVARTKGRRVTCSRSASCTALSQALPASGSSSWAARAVLSSIRSNWRTASVAVCDVLCSRVRFAWRCRMATPSRIGSRPHRTVIKEQAARLRGPLRVSGIYAACSKVREGPGSGYRQYV